MKTTELLAMVRPAQPKPIWQSSRIYQECLLSPQWVIEPKHDGYRCLVAHGSDGYRTESRKGHRLSVTNLPDLPQGTVADGEWMRLTGDLVLFDVPVMDGTLNPERFDSRRLQLLDLVPRLGKVRCITRLRAEVDVLAAAKRRGYEGLVLKRIGARYPEGETIDWLKVKG